MPTKSGIHLITKGFDLKTFNDNCKNKLGYKVDVKKNHLTLLYENL